MAEPERLTRPAAAARAEADKAGAPGPGTVLAASAFARIEDVVYVGLALILSGIALALLVDGAVAFGRALFAGDMPGQVVALLDRILLILMIVEILYTVQVSLRAHTLAPEPFLVVGLIAGVRRILVLTAEFSKLGQQSGEQFRAAMLELGLLTVMVVALVAALMMLRRWSAMPGRPAVERG